MERCFLKACGDPQEFEYEGAFRSWLVRILIDEALLILVERKRDLTTSSEQLLSEERIGFSSATARCGRLQSWLDLAGGGSLSNDDGGSGG